jgi:hypothetical protein
VKFDRSVDRLQRPIAMDRRTQPAAGGTGLLLGESFGPIQREPLRNRLGDGSSDSVSGRFQIVESPIPILEGLEIDSESLGHMEKGLPFPRTDFRPSHVCSSMNGLFFIGVA